MLAIPRRECEPGSPFWKPISAALRTNAQIKDFTHPGGLIRYWNTPKVRQRLKALPDRWRAELERRFQQRLAEINDAGPHIETNES